MAEILLVLSPIVVSLATSLLKKMGIHKKLTDGTRRAVVRLVVVILSFGAALGTAALAGQEVDATQLEMLTKGILVFLSSIGIYSVVKKK